MDLTFNASRWYVVRAEDATTGHGGPCRDGNEESNTTRVAASADGPSGIGTWTDDAGDTDIAKMAVDFFAAKSIGVTTNVVGPMTGRYLAGSRITNILGWVPGSGRQVLGVCIFSYDGLVRVGFKADADVVVAPETLVHAFDDEMDTLVRLAAAV